MKYVLTVKQNKATKEFFIILPKKLIKKMGWKIGDFLEWKDQRDGSFILIKKEKSYEQI